MAANYGGEDGGGYGDVDGKMAAARVAVDDKDADDLVFLSCFLRWPLHGICRGGREGAPGMPYDRSYERVRSYGTLSFALFLLVRLPLDLLYLLFTPFHVLT